VDPFSRIIIDAFRNPACYPHPIGEVTIVETHISWVILTGQYAYKIKKSVSFSFVDFSTLEQRRWFCEEEVRLNRRLAPKVYLGVVPLTGSPLAPRIEGAGPPFEFAVKMQQFSSGQEVYNILASKEQSEVFISKLAHCIAQFHTQIEKIGEESCYANPDMIWRSVGECVDEISLHLLTQNTQEWLIQINRWLQEEWRRLYDDFLQRKQSGYVRECHGDLHLANIAVFQGNVCVFDALEFEPRLRWIDVMSEVAFLVMDLQKNGRRDLAFLFLNGYLEETGDYAGLAVFRFYQVYRALVRAKVAGLRVEQLDKGSGEWERTRQEMIDYLELSYRWLKPSSPFLIMMHGVSGTGKTTVSAEVVKALGAIRIRSDVERKRLGVRKREAERDEECVTDLYSSTMTQATYDLLRDLANTILRAGYSVVVDATFLRTSQRAPFLLLVQGLQRSFVILDVWAPQQVLVHRIERRTQKANDASDATLGVLQQQQEIGNSFTEGESLNVFRVDSTNAHSLQLVLEKISEKLMPTLLIVIGYEMAFRSHVFLFSYLPI